jgi:hypothetical protein
MSGQLVDASIVAAPKQRNSKARSRRSGRVASLRAGRTVRPSSGRRIGCALDGEVHQGQAAWDGRKQVDLAIPQFGYQNHISTDRRHRLIRRWHVTDAAATQARG